MTAVPRRLPADEGRPPNPDFIERARQACVAHRVASEGTDPDSVRVPADAFDELVQQVIGAVQGRVEQIVPLDSAGHFRNTFSALVIRRLAERCEVQRFYLFPSSHDNRSGVSRQIEADFADGVVSAAVPITGLGKRAPQIPMNPVWLVDDQVVIRQVPDGGNRGHWLVTRRPAEVDRARTLIATARICAGSAKPLTGPDLTAWTFESAELLQKIAPMSCRGGTLGDGESCAWYHGVWQYLRLFDMVSSPSWHASFYVDQLRRQIGDLGARRILINGAADYTTLAFVLDAAREQFRDLDVHVIDQCHTPLLACRWYAERLGATVTTHLADATREDDLGAAGLDLVGNVDLIVADDYLPRFATNMANRVVAKWSRLLRPGGSVITTVRLHPSNEYADQDAVDPTFGRDCRVTDPVDNFELRLRERASFVQDMLPFDLDSLSHAARRHAQRMISHDLGDEQQVAQIFDRHDFDVECTPPVRVDGELVGTKYVRLTARRRDRP